MVLKSAAHTDATSIVLFEVFFEMVKTMKSSEGSGSSITAETLAITSKIVYMAAGEPQN